MKQTLWSVGFCLALVGLTANPAKGVTLDFESLLHGDVVRNQFASSGVTVSVSNPNESNDMFDLGVIFNADPLAHPGISDDDLQGPNWSTGNLSTNTVLGNILIIQENLNNRPLGSDYETDSSGQVVKITDPLKVDDEGRRPAGSIFFDFTSNITNFGFDLVDIEQVSADLGAVRFFSDSSSVTPILDIDLNTLLTANSAVVGNNSINRIAPIDLTGLGAIRRAEVKFGGSGGLDNVTADAVPEPSTVLLMGSGLAGLAWWRWRRKSSS
ncbi:PEP-CTERM sorting domain-containing protein [Candidatus Nitronereus thalassa]|uniref:PEP-CTERM sorting domain-containing protein n=1 Tax=Candidatus Nitronereus thalassa TaxID=3020898 RepID=A0ABU3KBQ1_9BACT|nr:PEP-CTERM sorting domain-containing protein [Candidatus Nitronereus thalassa]MDT7043602.1 PEP-CTERM sorting domain-containing protein [Candidatus Nitronereus thalassa]